MRKLGQFYREEILSLDRLTLRELPSHSDDIFIEQDLFGWKLYSDNKYIECSSEEEARYLKVFLDARVREIYIPKDYEQLKAILPKLEHIKEAHDRIINKYARGILNRNLKRKLFRKAWTRLMDEAVNPEKDSPNATPTAHRRISRHI